MGGVRVEPVVKGEESKSANPVLPPNKHTLNCSAGSSSVTAALSQGDGEQELSLGA